MTQPLASAPTRREAVALAFALLDRSGYATTVPAHYQPATEPAAEAIAVATVTSLEYFAGYCAALLRTPANA
jgi:hypothetical protein